jgi:hypothetical protein
MTTQLKLVTKITRIKSLSKNTTVLRNELLRAFGYNSLDEWEIVLDTGRVDGYKFQNSDTTLDKLLQFVEPLELMSKFKTDDYEQYRYMLLGFLVEVQIVYGTTNSFATIRVYE